MEELNEQNPGATAPAATTTEPGSDVNQVSGSPSETKVNEPETKPNPSDEKSIGTEENAASKPSNEPSGTNQTEENVRMYPLTESEALPTIESKPAAEEAPAAMSLKHPDDGDDELGGDEEEDEPMKSPMREHFGPVYAEFNVKSVDENGAHDEDKKGSTLILEPIATESSEINRLFFRHLPPEIHISVMTPDTAKRFKKGAKVTMRLWIEG